MPDSYDMLAKSIERVIRSDLPPPVSAQQLAGSIERIMATEARAGELRLAWLRVLVVAPLVGVSLEALLRRHAEDPLSMTPYAAAAALAISVSWLAVALALALALQRGWYRRWLPHAMPPVDATMIAAVYLVPLFLGVGSHRVVALQALASVGALCFFLAISGGLRLSRSSSRWGTGFAILVFAASATVAGLGLMPTVAISFALLGTGLLSASIAGLVRRLVTDEVARTALSEMYDEAAQAIDAREQVLKIVSHDLRNPLHTIEMAAALLLEIDMPDDVRNEHLRRIKRAGERMDRLVSDLLDVAKLDAGRVAIVPRDLEVAPLLREAYEMLAPLAAEASITLELDASERLPTINADAGRVLQVFSNLVGNAIKFTPPGGRIVVKARPAPLGVQFSVSDTGPGIPAEQAERIFGRFWQADAADRRGIGLGLTIAKGIMDAHGGRLWVESRVGEGTTFHFVLGSMPPRRETSRDRRMATSGGTREQATVG